MDYYLRSPTMTLEAKLAYGRLVIERWKKSREPFLLYLRDFRMAIKHGDGFTLENHFWGALPLKGIGVLTLLNDEAPHIPEFSGLAPALKVPDSEWKTVVTDLIGKALMIVAEVPFVSDGSRFELETCDRVGRNLETVVIIPPPDSVFDVRDDDQTIKKFPRVIHLDEISREAIDHFVFADLVERGARLAGLTPKRRKQIVDDDQVHSEFPLDVRALLAGYRHTADAFYAFGHYKRAGRAIFRALVTAVMIADKAVQAELAEYMAVVCLAGHDYLLARNYVAGGVKLAKEAGDRQRHERLKQRLVELDVAILQGKKDGLIPG